MKKITIILTDKLLDEITAYTIAHLSPSSITECVVVAMIRERLKTLRATYNESRPFTKPEPKPAPTLNLDANQGAPHDLTAKNVAEMLSICPSTVYDLTRMDHDPLPCSRRGRLYRFRAADVLAWDQRQRNT